ncbi:sigma D regulator [Motiliproteus sediminis]|uniref:sigma D regulator n=1 Tax=Motiliproteus sediminis TaxID=1468178 RepID=UPI001AEF8886|nr:sigma D regulator [Motiliproteus sediminis]
MLEKCLDARERWGGVSELIDRWLHERQDLLSRFIGLPQLTLDKDVAPSLQGFCEVLVDYVSSWHFGVYEHLLAEADSFNDGGIELARELDPKLQATTDEVLSFNDQFSEVDSLTLQDASHLGERLSRLGEVLAERFELEDNLIERLHTAHKDRL